MRRRIMILVAAVALAGTAFAAQRDPQPSSSAQPRPAPITRSQQIAVKPDIEPVKPGWLPSPHAGVGSLGGQLVAKNHGPGTLDHSFTWRLSCTVIAKEFDLGPCLYKTYQQARDAQGAFPTLTAVGALSNFPAPPGQQFWHQLPYSIHVNCRHDMGGKCHITLEVDTNNVVAESKETNNTVTVIR